MNLGRMFCCCAVLAPSVLLANPLQLPRDGWVSWQVKAVADAPNWCCFDDPEPHSCQLDGLQHSYGSREGDGPVEHIQVYAQLHAGKLQRLRAYGQQCAVSASAPIEDLGEIDPDSSARWLVSQLGSAQARSDLLAALASHAGPVADQQLLRLANDNQSAQLRKDAMFWLGQLRGEPGARALQRFMTDDEQSAIREHAAFSLSQSKSAQRGEWLISQAQQDSSPRVRSQAWFWLAQIADPGSEMAIAAALKTETSEAVRQQAVFALAQLPAPRNVQALISMLEDRSLPLAERKQALFWLAQNETAAAQNYLAQVLDDAP